MLTDLRVVEVGYGMAAAIAGMILGDLGADVVRIQPDGPEPFVHPVLQTWHRNKRVVRLDFGSTQTSVAVRGALQNADILLTSNEEALTVLGLPLHRLRAEFPDLIVCASRAVPEEITDLPHLDPVSHPATEALIAARVGFLDPGTRADPSSRPRFSALPIGSGYAAILMAIGAVAGVYRRDRGGGGAIVRTSLQGALMCAMSLRLIRTNWDGTALSPQAEVRVRQRYRCGDGRWLQIVPAPRHLQLLCSTLGIQPEVCDETSVFSERLAEAFLTAGAEEWETRLSDVGLAACMPRSVSEWREHPHAREAGLVRTVHTDLGLLPQPGALIEPSTLPSGSREADMPHLGWPARGAHPSAESGRLLPLEGVRVLDLSLVLAGPVGGRVLAELGADVIKVDGPSTLPAATVWLEGNRGKRSVFIDLNTDAGREVLWDLLAEADVLLENFSLGTAERMGFGYEAVHERFPHLIYASLNCYGYAGSFAGRHGWEHTAQAGTGMQMEYGGAESPSMLPFALNDVAGGHALALAVLAALRERDRRGVGRHVTTSLSAVAGLMGALSLTGPDLDGTEPPIAPSLGYAPTSRLAQCRDGWVYIHCPPERQSTFVQLIRAARERGELRPRSVVACDSNCAGDQVLAPAVVSQVLVQHPMSAVITSLRDAGIMVTEVRRPWDLFADEDVRDAGLMRNDVSDVYGLTEHVGPASRYSWDTGLALIPVPPPGADSREVLSGLDRTPEQIDHLFAAGIVNELV